MYTIKINKSSVTRDRLIAALSGVISKSAFRADFQPGPRPNEIYVKPVRLREAKGYCGQHPGECLVGGPRRKTRFLEWDDWVAFHGIVNNVLDKLQVDADVWTVPPERMDQGKKMWVRRGLRRRVRYEWEDDWAKGNMRGPLRVWNHGTDDQFDQGA